MYINWQLDYKHHLTLVSTYSEQGVLFSNILKFNPSASVIVALLDSGYGYEKVLEYLSNIGPALNNEQEIEVKDFIGNLDKSGVFQKLRKDKNRLMDSFAGFDLNKFTTPKIVFNKTFRGMANDKWSKYLGKYASHEQFYYPIKVNFDVTQNCNLQCDFCYLGPSKGPEDLSLDKIKLIIDKLKESNVQLVNLFGGEPFVRKDIFEIIEYIRSKGMNVVINTNGLLLGDEVIPKLKAATITSLHISLDADNKELYLLLRKSDKFNTLINNIKNSVKAGLPVQINVTLMKKNLFRLYFIYRLANKIGIPVISVGLVHSLGSGKDNRNLFSVNRVLYFVWVKLFKIISLFSRAEYYVKEVCDANSYIHLDYLGNCHFCSQMPRTMVLGNILENNLLDIWHSLEYKNLFSLRRLSEPCRSCLFRALICNNWRCRAERYANENDFFAANPYCLLGKLSKMLSR